MKRLTASSARHALGAAVVATCLVLPATAQTVIEPVTLHFHGVPTHTEGGPDEFLCAGNGSTDVATCDGPYLAPSAALGVGAPGRWEADPALNGANARTIYDPSFIWHLEAPEPIGGRADIAWWASCGACGGPLSADWLIRVFVDGTDLVANKVFEQRITATPDAPNVPKRLTASIILPDAVANTSVILHIDPVFVDSQQNTRIYYDSQSPCPGAEGTEACDSTITFRLPVPPPPPPAADEDGDGIFDETDRCPGTPAATPVNSAGCAAPADSPRYDIFQAPSGVGTDVGEPSVGSNWLTETIFTNTNVDGTTNDLPNGGTALEFGGFSPALLKVTFNDCASPAYDTWDEKPLLAANAPRALGDPILFTDNRTGRTWVVQLFPGAGATIDITDDDGDNFIPSDGMFHQGADFDHETIAAGPYHAPLAPTPAYDGAVYYAAQGVSQAKAWRSDNGGLVFNPGTVMYTVNQCSGLHGHVKVAPDGTVYVPPRGCGGTDVVFHTDGEHAVVVSEDNGLTWELRPIPGSTSEGNGSSGDPSVGIATDGTVYFGMESRDGRPYAAVSRDKGRTWSTPVDIGAAVTNGRRIENAVWPSVVAGDPDRAAITFFGSETAGDGSVPDFPGHWYLYVASTFDGGDTWVTTNITPGDPIQRGGICNGGTCRNLLDFFDATIDKQGRVLIAGEDGCITTSCINGGPNDFTAKAFIPRQSGGKRMFAAFDPPQPDRPGAPALAGSLNGDATVANLSWPMPDSGGAEITAYNVYKRIGLVEPFTLIATVTGNSYADTNHDNSVENYYHVTAVNAVGESPYCLNFRPTFVQLPNVCDLPGALVIDDFTQAGGDDDTGQNVPPDGRVNVKQLYFAEPDLGAGVEKLVITLQVAPSNAGLAPANSEWFVIWNRQNPNSDFDRWYVAMRTDGAGTPTFEYGQFGVPLNPTGPNPNANTPVKLGDADSGSYDVATGVITITLAKAKAEDVSAGDSLAGINVRTYLGRNGAPGQRSQNNASDITGEGIFTLAGNCVGNLAPSALLIAYPDTGEAPLEVTFDAGGSSDEDGAVTTYNFDFGDEEGIQSTSPTVTHTYTSPGTYHARVTVVDDLGKTSAQSVAAEFTVTVSPLEMPPLPQVAPQQTIENNRLGGAWSALAALALAAMALARRRLRARRS